VIHEFHVFFKEGSTPSGQKGLKTSRPNGAGWGGGWGGAGVCFRVWTHIRGGGGSLFCLWGGREYYPRRGWGRRGVAEPPPAPTPREGEEDQRKTRHARWRTLSSRRWGGVRGTQAMQETPPWMKTPVGIRQFRFYFWYFSHIFGTTPQRAIRLSPPRGVLVWGGLGGSGAVGWGRPSPTRPTHPP